MNIIYNDSFDYFENDNQSRVFQVFPNVFKDQRGSFTEVFKEDNDSIDRPTWFKTSDWIKQINRSVSKARTVRGCHAQKGSYCQGKFVEAITEKIYDIITDARPDSKTFGVSQVFILDPEKSNKLWVPRGFLHAFSTTTKKADFIFQYYCDNVYDKKSEFGINPKTILPELVSNLRKMNSNDFKNTNEFFDLFKVFEDIDSLELSQKDIQGLDYNEFMKKTQSDFEQKNILWYR